MRKSILEAILICLSILAVVHSVDAADGLHVERKNLDISGKSLPVCVVYADLDKYRPKVGIAQGRVGLTESLGGMAKRYDAIAGINGSFFDAYTKDIVKPPYHHLATGGFYVHLGNTGTTLGFDENGDYRMDQLLVTVRGLVIGDGPVNNWYAYRINHPALSSNTATAYTGLWAASKTPCVGKQITVSGDRIQAIGPGPVDIPEDGYVLVLKGGEECMANRFRIGATCSFRMEFQGKDSEFWKRAQEVMGCGPQLLREGQLCRNFRSEGFKESKILTQSRPRSAVGLTRSGRIMLVYCKSATMNQMARVMKALGAWDAMNMDGGGSQALWVNGRYLVGPGRNLSNSLLLVPR